MGLPGSGKTTLASELVPLLKAKWLNADKVRKAANDWDFSYEGIERQAKRMSDLAETFKNKTSALTFPKAKFALAKKTSRSRDSNSKNKYNF